MPRPEYTVLWPLDRRHYLSVEWHPLRRPRRPSTPAPDATPVKLTPRTSRPAARRPTRPVQDARGS